MSPCFCWPAEHMKNPSNTLLSWKDQGSSENFQFSSAATRQYETLITGRNGLGNGLHKTFKDKDLASGDQTGQACKQHWALDELHASIWHSTKTCIYIKGKQGDRSGHYPISEHQVILGVKPKVRKCLCSRDKISFSVFATHRFERCNAWLVAANITWFIYQNI